MKKILLLMRAPRHSENGQSNSVGLCDLLRKEFTDEIQVEVAVLNRLTFVVDGDATAISDKAHGFDVADFDLVVFRTIGKQLEEAIAVAAYCRKKKVPYIDQYVPTVGNNKLGGAFIRWEHDLPVPKTVYGPLEGMLDELPRIGLPAILKADAGRKGQDNHLVRSAEDIQARFNEPDAPLFVLQNFIPNDGDYRVLVFNDQPVMAVRRLAAEGSHLNNTSQGGTAEAVTIADLPEGVAELAVAGTKLEKLAVAGADILLDKTTGQPYILEINRAPQLNTGAFAEQKVEQYAAMLKTLLEKGEKA